LSPWSIAAHQREMQHAGAERHWHDTTVRQLVKKIEELIASPVDNEEKQGLAGRLVRELQTGDGGLVRHGGAATAAAIEASRTIHDFIVEHLTPPAT
jgi:hypothetical protein